MLCRKEKKWTTPQLVVLVKGKPEEGILAQCKSGSTFGATTTATGYRVHVYVCGVCSGWATS
jgi:hypothetical protein